MVGARGHRHGLSRRRRNHPQLARGALHRGPPAHRRAQGLLGHLRGQLRPRGSEKVPVPAHRRPLRAVSGVLEHVLHLGRSGRRRRVGRRQRGGAEGTRGGFRRQPEEGRGWSCYVVVRLPRAGEARGRAPAHDRGAKSRRRRCRLRSVDADHAEPGRPGNGPPRRRARQGRERLGQYRSAQVPDRVSRLGPRRERASMEAAHLLLRRV
mmetsp:Transcript_8743/g.24952  ORF Transcript_8743/g.24952 Transcript_8743/m.24952 type:complete len:209 (-) Transcript_8743:1790-2416(-)